jgi:hypothetical protein
MRLMLWSMLLLVGFAAVPDFRDADNPLLPVQTRSHQHSRARATRAARPDLDHSVEHIDDEFASEVAVAPAGDKVNVRKAPVPVSEAAAQAIWVFPPGASTSFVAADLSSEPRSRTPLRTSGRSPPFSI